MTPTPPRLPVERVLFLKRISWLSALHLPDLAVLGEYAQERRSRRGDLLLRGGEPVEAMHFVVDGRLRLARRGRALGHAEVGSVIGARLLLAQDGDGLEAVAEADTTTLALDRESFLDALEDRFEIYLGVLRETCRELVELFRENPAEAAPASGPAPPAAGGDLDLVERIVLLRSRRPFEACSIDALAELAQRLEEVRRPAGTVLWRRGERATRLLLVAGGRVRCEPARPEATFWMGPGQPLGTLELLAELPRWYDAVAEEPVTALEGGVDQLVDVFEDDVDMGLGFLAHLARTSIEIQERVAEREGSLPQLFGCEGSCA